MTYQLVLQWAASSLADDDRLIRIEDTLIAGITEQHEVDGHDEGSGEMNIFIRTDDPLAAFERIRGILDRDTLKSVRVAYREVSGSTYTVLWPKDLTNFTVA